MTDDHTTRESRDETTGEPRADAAADDRPDRVRTDDDAFERRFAEIVASMGDLPPQAREHLEALMEETRDRHADNREQVARAREGLRTLEATEELFHLNMQLLAEMARRSDPS